MRDDLPTGTVTFLFTDVEGSTKLLHSLGAHNHMDGRLHFLAPGDGSGGVDEYCFCFVSGP